MHNLKNASFKNLDVKEFVRFIDRDEVQLLDVRTPEEFADGHLPGAMNIDVLDPDFMDVAVLVLDKSRPVAVYCRSGKRSTEAATMLAEEGFDVGNLRGGILAWTEAGQPIT